MRDFLRFKSRIITTSVALAISTPLFGAEETLNIYGWLGTADIFKSDAPDAWLGDDAVVGRQACPSLLRYNVAQKSSEPVLLKNLPEIDSDKWVFGLRSGLRWWDGSAIAPKDLAEFLERELTRLNEKMKLGVFKVHVKSYGADVEWVAAPKYGPYLLSGRPFWRPKLGQNPAYECAGLYKVTQIEGRKSILLSVATGYSSRFNKLRLSVDARQKSEPFVSFELAEDRSQMQSTKTKTACPTKIDLPLVTTIIWNPKGTYTSSAKIRQALTNAVPRGEILRTTGGELGSLISGPLLRVHPGYMPGLVVRPYSLETSDQILAAQGYSQASIGTPRKGADGKTMHLKIGLTTDAKQDLIEKIITDSFASIGIEVEFVAKSAAAPFSNLDGVLLGVSLPWPSLDLSETFHSGSLVNQQSFPFYPTDDKSLDELLGTYAESFSKGKPRFDVLSKIHARFMELEPWTMIMSHQACVVSKGITVKGKVHLSDPDWFRHQILD